MYIWLEFSPKAAKFLDKEQGPDSPERLTLLTNKNVDNFSNVMRKPGSKNANGMPNKGQQVAITAQKNL